LKRIKTIFFLIISTAVAFIACQKNIDGGLIQKTGTIKITFKNTIKGTPVVLNAGVYTNVFAEQYSLTKFKYYISNVSVNNIGNSSAEKESYHLIDESKPASLSFSYSGLLDLYSALNFTIGVDSLRNVSGAQTGALDPLNDMFWTWNTGYIMAKMEGNSPQSAVVNNKVEYHIGGFSGANNVLKKLSLTLPAGKALNVREGKVSEIIIECDIDKWWQIPNDIKITADPVCTTPGALAKKIADNYSKMFTITDVINN
jgi:hypothetical protein